MKKTINHVVGLTLAATIGMLAAPASFAATRPGVNVMFDRNIPSHVFSVRPHSWSDPAFGHQAWTHHCQWGRVRAKRGDRVTIRLTSATVGVHPAATVYFRGRADTAPDSFVPDHFFHQLGDSKKMGAIAEQGGADLGNIVMRYVTHGYERDGNSLNFTLFNPISDGTAGYLELTFQARRTGVYAFAVGAINPDPAINATLRYNITGEVSVTRPGS